VGDHIGSMFHLWPRSPLQTRSARGISIAQMDAALTFSAGAHRGGTVLLAKKVDNFSGSGVSALASNAAVLDGRYSSSEPHTDSPELRIQYTA